MSPQSLFRHVRHFFAVSGPLFRHAAFPSVAILGCVYVCMSLRISIGLLLALRRFAFFAAAGHFSRATFRGRGHFYWSISDGCGRFSARGNSWMCGCMSLHISIGLSNQLCVRSSEPRSLFFGPATDAFILRCYGHRLKRHRCMLYVVCCMYVAYSWMCVCRSIFQ